MFTQIHLCVFLCLRRDTNTTKIWFTRGRGLGGGLGESWFDLWWKWSWRLDRRFSLCYKHKHTHFISEHLIHFIHLKPEVRVLFWQLWPSTIKTSVCSVKPWRSAAGKTADPQTNHFTHFTHNKDSVARGFMLSNVSERITWKEQFNIL